MCLLIKNISCYINFQWNPCSTLLSYNILYTTWNVQFLTPTAGEIAVLEPLRCACEIFLLLLLSNSQSLWYYFLSIFIF